MIKMIKKMSVLLLVLMIATSLVGSAFAVDSNVSFDGNAEDFVFEPGSNESLSDLFPDIKGVMPGDKLTQKITVRNRSNMEVKIYLRSLGAKAGSEEFLNQLKLTVKQDGNSTLFEAAADKTAQLTDWVLLGTLASGAKIDLIVTLEVPIEMDNRFQNAVGRLQWEFMVEEVVHETTVPETTVPETTVPETTVPETTVPETTVPETTKPGETSKPTKPSEPVDPDGPAQTGDEANLLYHTTMMIVSALGLFLVIFAKKNRKDENVM